MEKVIYKTLISANVRVDNSVDADRVYDISADVNVTGGNVVGNIDAGEVKKKDSSAAATFNAWDNNLNVSYQNVDAQEQCIINTAINSFITDVRTKVAEATPLSM